MLHEGSRVLCKADQRELSALVQHHTPAKLLWDRQPIQSRPSTSSVAAADEGDNAPASWDTAEGASVSTDPAQSQLHHNLPVAAAAHGLQADTAVSVGPALTSGSSSLGNNQSGGSPGPVDSPVQAASVGSATSAETLQAKMAELQKKIAAKKAAAMRRSSQPSATLPTAARAPPAVVATATAATAAATAAPTAATTAPPPPPVADGQSHTASKVAADSNSQAPGVVEASEVSNTPGQAASEPAAAAGKLAARATKGAKMSGSVYSSSLPGAQSQSGPEGKQSMKSHSAPPVGTPGNGHADVPYNQLEHAPNAEIGDSPDKYLTSSQGEQQSRKRKDQPTTTSPVAAVPMATFSAAPSPRPGSAVPSHPSSNAVCYAADNGTSSQNPGSKHGVGATSCGLRNKCLAASQRAFDALNRNVPKVLLDGINMDMNSVNMLNSPVVRTPPVGGMAKRLDVGNAEVHPAYATKGPDAWDEVPLEGTADAAVTSMEVEPTVGVTDEAIATPMDVDHKYATYELFSSPVFGDQPCPAFGHSASNAEASASRHGNNGVWNPVGNLPVNYPASSSVAADAADRSLVVDFGENMDQGE